MGNSEYQTYRVVVKSSFINKDGNLQHHENVIYLDMTGPGEFSTSKVFKITMEKFIPNEPTDGG